ncbi:MAG: hypothetical protein IPG23_05520 [Burkholderiales bacterium]|nr:hypothetical protein [Burkholderiales bacterium]
MRGNETVIATINSATSNAVPLTATTASATGTITDNDTPTIAVSVLPVSVLEDGIPNLVYTFTLSNTSAFATTVNYTLSGTAANGTDYSGSAVTGTVTIPANSLSASITINPSTDTAAEANETVIATINSATSNAVSLTITTAAATGTITDDDTPSISGARTSSVSEEGLTNGIVDTFGTIDTTNSVTNTGQFTVSNATE